MKTDGGRRGCAAVCNAGVHNPKSGCTIFASPSSANHCNTVHLTASLCISLQHGASHCNSVHPLHLIPLHHPPLHQGQAALAPGAGCSSGELGSMRWRLFFAHRGIVMEVEVFFKYKYRGLKSIWLNARPFKFQTGWV